MKKQKPSIRKNKNKNENRNPRAEEFNTRKKKKKEFNRKLQQQINQAEVRISETEIGHLKSIKQRSPPPKKKV